MTLAATSVTSPASQLRVSPQGWCALGGVGCAGGVGSLPAFPKQKPRRVKGGVTNLDALRARGAMVNYRISRQVRQAAIDGRRINASGCAAFLSRRKRAIDKDAKPPDRRRQKRPFACPDPSDHHFLAGAEPASAEQLVIN